MKNSLKIVAVSAIALTFAGCASDKHDMDMDMKHNDLDSIAASVEETRAAAIQANQNAQAAYELASQNAEKINRVWRKSQLK